MFATESAHFTKKSAVVFVYLCVRHETLPALLQSINFRKSIELAHQCSVMSFSFFLAYGSFIIE
jgi:hypothetical protein